MPSNDSPAFDVLSADENDLWEWAVERAGVENAATYIRDVAVQAERVRQTERGEVGETRPAYGKLRKEYDAQRAELKECVAKLKALRESQAPEAEREPNELADAQRLLAIVMEQRAELTAELDALKQSRDTDLARARVEGAREALTKYADSARGMAAMMRDRPCSPRNATANDIEHFRDREYPAPKPAECRLSDGSVVTFRETTAGSYGPSFWRTRDDGTTLNGDWRWLLTCNDTGADFDALKAFAATRTEGQ